MQCGNIHFLWLLWVLPLIVLFYWWAFRRKNYLIEKFVSSELRTRLMAGVSPQRQRLKVALLIVAVAAAIVALIRPKYGFHWEEVQRRGVDIVIALDVSKSMLAEDMSPNRLERAKREIVDFLTLITGDRIALVAFAGEGFLQCPLTLDYGAMQIFLDDLDTDLIPVPGTAIDQAISKSIAAFDPDDKRSRAMILITDGEDNSGRALAMAEKAKEQQIRIYAIGIGKEGGAPIPDSAHGGFKKNRAGEVVLSKLDEDTLQKIALATGGSYVRATTGNLDLESIYHDIRANIEDKDLHSGRRKQYEERFQWPLGLALLLLAAELLVQERKRGALVLLLLAAGLNLAPGELSAHPFSASAGKKGEQAYREHRYGEALSNFLAAQIDEPNNWQIKYNLANTYYNLGDYEKAQQLYSDIATNGPQDLQGKAEYNVGNTSYRQGKLEEAITHYEHALARNPQDEDAKSNLAFVREEIKRRIEEQKKRQEQQKQDEQKPGDQKDQKQDQKQDEQKQGQDAKAAEDKKAAEEKKDKQGEDHAGAQGKEEKKPEQEKPEDGKAGAQDSAAPSPEQGMSKEEAEHWLSTLQGDRKEYIKKKFKGSRQYDVEKDW